MNKIAIPDAPGYYICDNGEVYSERSQKFMKQYLNTNGYYIVEPYMSNGKRKKLYIHRLLAEAFIPNDDPLHKTQVNHKDENRLNNTLSNLEWISMINNL